MSHIFNLQPNIPLLHKLGYVDNIDEQSTPLNHTLNLEIESVTTVEERLFIEESFSALTSKFDLSEYNDTLLYIILLENERAGELFELEHLTYEQRLRDKELAQLLMLYNPNNKFKPLSIKINSAIDSLTIKSKDVIDWMGSLAGQFISQGEFTPGLHGFTLLQFISEKGTLNYSVIEQISKTGIRKPDIRTRNKYLAPFLLKLYAILNAFTPLKAASGTRFSDSQLNLLFKIAEIFNWLDEQSIDSDPKDYLGTLLNNYISKHKTL